MSTQRGWSVQPVGEATVNPWGAYPFYAQFGQQGAPPAPPPPPPEKELTAQEKAKLRLQQLGGAFAQEAPKKPQTDAPPPPPPPPQHGYGMPGVSEGYHQQPPVSYYQAAAHGQGQSYNMPYYPGPPQPPPSGYKSQKPPQPPPQPPSQPPSQHQHHQHQPPQPPPSQPSYPWSTGKEEIQPLSVRSTSTGGWGQASRAAKRQQPLEQGTPLYIPVESSSSALSPSVPLQKKSKPGQEDDVAVPAGFKGFAHKCLSYCETKKQKKKVKAALHNRFVQVKESGASATHDWSKEPLPPILLSFNIKSIPSELQFSSKADKKAAVLAAAIEAKKAYDQRFMKDARSGTLDSFSSLIVKKGNEKGKRGKGGKQRINALSRVERNTEPIVGTCMDLEKDHFRLTSEVDAATVRPEVILHKALKHVLRKRKEGCSYKWVCSQLKAIRQDLTIQHIKNSFTVKAYETHARIALEEGDFLEFNQCALRLASFYADGIEGNATEFLAYQLLDHVAMGNMRAALQLLQTATPAQRELPSLRHAREVKEAVESNDYAVFFRLYKTAPDMAPYLMDRLRPQVRKTALRLICAAMTPTIPISYLTLALSFETDRKTVAYLDDHELRRFITGGQLKCAQALECLREQLQQEQSQPALPKTYSMQESTQQYDDDYDMFF
eukprot:m.38118 g.38118  ORF g.38118 m.38118 type:complete len:664 (+) comp10158_c1_seq1:161-2152(+)